MLGLSPDAFVKRFEELLTDSKENETARRRLSAERAGGPGDLPVGCQYSPEELVYWARHNMPDVQAAVEEFNRRGYVMVPAADTAITGCPNGVAFSGVTLAFMKPGAFIDSSHVVAPMILVTTRLNHHPRGFHPCGGGLMVGERRGVDD